MEARQCWDDPSSCQSSPHSWQRAKDYLIDLFICLIRGLELGKSQTQRISCRGSLHSPWSLCALEFLMLPGLGVSSPRLFGLTRFLDKLPCVLHSTLRCNSYTVFGAKLLPRKHRLARLRRCCLPRNLASTHEQ